MAPVNAAIHICMAIYGSLAEASAAAAPAGSAILLLIDPRYLPKTTILHVSMWVPGRPLSKMAICAPLLISSVCAFTKTFCILMVVFDCVFKMKLVFGQYDYQRCL